MTGAVGPRRRGPRAPFNQRHTTYPTNQRHTTSRPTNAMPPINRPTNATSPADQPTLPATCHKSDVPVCEVHHRYQPTNYEKYVSETLQVGLHTPNMEYMPVARIFFFGGGVRSLERKGYFCQRFSVAVKSIYNQLRHDNSLLL